MFTTEITESTEKILKVIFRVRQRRQLIVVPTRENTNLVLVDFVDQPMLIVDPAGPTTFQFMP